MVGLVKVPGARAIPVSRDVGDAEADGRLEIESGGVWVRVPIKTVCLSVSCEFGAAPG